ncbi:2-beta-glucuronyltransferase [Marinobacter segnicrescens]|uniref:2-beta-glucuronyltransferase n=1 Tax=Marinobacter segnicrescens TaxID=430453 RepID=A0A1I0AQV2_9GAMM|nr:glycosyltransferase [Marinobacter segnicrescens]SES95846.1 2-beta-glucuronyltransferase [Marinobacter segnicrescens]
MEPAIRQVLRQSDGEPPSDRTAGTRTTGDSRIGAGLRYLVLSAHDYRSPRKANIHFIARELAKRGPTRFFSLRYSLLSRQTGDPRLSLDHQANRIETRDGVECYLWKTPVHPFNTRRPALRALEDLMYWGYVALASRVLRTWLAEADVVVFESGVAPVFFDLARQINPRVKTVYIASDDLDTINVAEYVKAAFNRAAPDMTTIRIPSRALLPGIPSRDNVVLVPHGIDHKLAETSAASPYRDALNAVSVGSMLFDPGFFAEASHRFPNVHFHIIGCGQPHHPSYGPNVTVYDEMPHEETVRYIRHADIGIAPYRSESVPGYLADTSMKLIQYDFLGVPAVCPHSVTGDYGSRFGYTPGDGVSVEQAITRALNAPREASRRHLSWSEVTDRILEPSAFPDTEVIK